MQAKPLAFAHTRPRAPANPDGTHLVCMPATASRRPVWSLSVVVHAVQVTSSQRCSPGGTTWNNERDVRCGDTRSTHALYFVMVVTHDQAWCSGSQVCWRWMTSQSIRVPVSGCVHLERRLVTQGRVCLHFADTPVHRASSSRALSPADVTSRARPISSHVQQRQLPRARPTPFEYR